MDEEILLVVPLVVGGVAVAAVLGSGSDVGLAALLPGLGALAVIAFGTFLGVRRYGWGKPTDGTATGSGGGGGDATPAAGTGPRADGGAAAEVTPLVRRREEVRYEGVEAADGMRKGVLVGPDDGAPNLALRRFVLAPGASVPRHTNEIEHEQYVLEGGYTVGIGEEEYELETGDSLLIPAGTVHWYRNEGSEQCSFLCAVPTGDDSIELV